MPPTSLTHVTPATASMLSLSAASAVRRPRGNIVSINARAVAAVQGAVRKFAPAPVQDHGVVRYANHHILQIERADGVARFYLVSDEAELFGVPLSRLVGATVNVDADDDYSVIRVRVAEPVRNLRAV